MSFSGLSLLLFLMPPFQYFLKTLDLDLMLDSMYLLQACYEAGSHGQALPPEFMNTLDNELIPIIHGQASTHAAFEFVFHILDL